MTVLFEAVDISKNFHVGKAGPAAVDNVSFTISSGTSVGLVGASGCGKSTLARILMGITTADAGSIKFNGAPVDFSDRQLRQKYYQQVQMIFQDAVSAFHPRKSIGASIMLPLLHYGYSKIAARKKLTELLASVGLSLQHAAKYPHQLSGGECQRAAIARAIGTSPQLLICDEITCALDMQIQKDILKLLLELQRSTKMSLLFISHDIILVQEICDSIMVMNSGQIIEAGTTGAIITAPRHEYTRALIEAALNIDN